MCARNIKGVPCKDYATWNTESNPHPNSIFPALFSLLAMFTFPTAIDFSDGCNTHLRFSALRQHRAYVTLT